MKTLDNYDLIIAQQDHLFQSHAAESSVQIIIQRGIPTIFAAVTWVG